MSTPTLSTIRTKVRRLTRSPSPAMITDSQIDDYVNTFILYDFPEHLRLFNLKQTLNFYTQANVDTYDSTNTDYDPNIYITVNPPMYVAGYQMLFTQSRENFYNMYPFTNTLERIGYGDGTTLTFSYILSAIPILPGQVTVGAPTSAGVSMELHDDGNGVLSGDGSGTINYITGAISVTFTSAPGANEDVNAQTFPYVPNRPQACLFFDDQFVMRPVPDQVYQVNVEVYKRPTELLSSGDAPQLQQWWQYIAYGASKKIFEDRVDTDSVAQIMPEFKQQERLVLRTTIVQQSNQRTATIYTNQVAQMGYNYGPFGIT